MSHKNDWFSALFVDKEDRDNYYKDPKAWTDRWVKNHYLRKLEANSLNVGNPDNTCEKKLLFDYERKIKEPNNVLSKPAESIENTIVNKIKL